MIALLKNRCRVLAKNYPHLTNEINDAWHACLDEIQDGGSEVEEVEMTMEYLDTIASDR